MIFLVYLTTTSIINFFLISKLNSKYKRKYNSFFCISIIMVFTIIVSFINTLHIPFLNLFSNLIGYLAIDVFLYNVHSTKECFKDCAYFFMLVFLDSISFFLVGLFYHPNEMLVVFRTLSSSILVVLLNATINRFIEKTKIDNLSINKMLSLFLISLFHLFLIFIFSENYDSLKNDFFKTVVIIIVIIQVLINLIIYHHLEYIDKSIRMEKQIFEINKRNELKKIYYMSLKEKYEANKEIIHDFKNFIQTLELSYKNDTNFLSNRIKSQIYAKLDYQKIKYNTSSDILDIILMDKEYLAQKEEIKFDFIMEILDLNFLSELDTIIIFGNLYDNAIEACKEVSSNRNIQTRIYQVNQMIIIKMKNSCANVLNYKCGKLYSTKKDHQCLGTTNIKKTVKRYNGVFNIEIIDNVCTVTLIFPLSTDKD